MIGKNFARNQRIHLAWDGATEQMPRVRTRANGSFKVTFRIPRDSATGKHELAAMGSDRSNTSELSSRSKTRIPADGIDDVTVFAPRPPPPADPVPVAPPTLPAETPTPEPPMTAPIADATDAVRRQRSGADVRTDADAAVDARADRARWAGQRADGCADGGSDTDSHADAHADADPHADADTHAHAQPDAHRAPDLQRAASDTVQRRRLVQPVLP